MSYMFAHSVFNQDISCWDVSGVSNMFGMFSYSKFNQNLDSWKIRSFCTKKEMFTGTRIKLPVWFK